MEILPSPRHRVSLCAGKQGSRGEGSEMSPRSLGCLFCCHKRKMPGLALVGARPGEAGLQKWRTMETSDHEIGTTVRKSTVAVHDSTRIRAEIANLRERLAELERLVGDPESELYPAYCDPRCSSCRGDEPPCAYPGECWEPYCVTASESHQQVPSQRGRRRRS